MATAKCPPGFPGYSQCVIASGAGALDLGWGDERHGGEPTASPYPAVSRSADQSRNTERPVMKKSPHHGPKRPLLGCGLC